MMIPLKKNDVERLARLAVSPDWLTFTAVAIGGAEFATRLRNGCDGANEEVIFYYAGAVSE